MVHMSSILKDLSNPDCLPDKTESVSVVQTHISFVFIADKFVYKVKKPVNLGFLDFSTLEKREYYCQQEIILNRRLSKDVYIDVLPITYEGGNYKMGRGQGRGASGFKDALLQGQKLKELYGDLFQKLRTELRVRHYSLRTEHAYKFVTYLPFTSPPFTVDLVFVRFL